MALFRPILHHHLNPFSTYDGSGQVVHPDFVTTPAGALGLPLHLVITPYPFGDAAFENPSFFESRRPPTRARPLDEWP